MSDKTGTEHTPRKVLLVDDELMLLRILARVLRSAGYDVQCAENGFQGLSLFQKQEWDIVVVDRAMPEMNGEELAQAIKTSSPQVPLIMITGFLDAILHPELFDAILAKPFLPGELVACLERTPARRAA